MAFDPRDHDVVHRLGIMATQDRGDPEAVRYVRRSLVLAPERAPAHSNLAELLRRLERTGEAARAARNAVVLDPALPEAHNGLGAACVDQGDVTGGLARFHRALAIRPDYREAAYNRAVAWSEAGCAAEAVRCYEAVLMTHPDFAEARWNHALALLAAGEWARGWQAHEYRRQHPQLSPRAFAFAPWDGGPLSCRRILLHSEQGLGDTIQFLRFVPEVVRRGGRVVLDVPDAVAPLIPSAWGVEEVVVTGAPVPPVDLHAPLMSLPLLLRLTSAPPEPPYIAVDAARRQRWQTRVSYRGRRVGIAWAGSPVNRNDRRRSVPAELLPRLWMPEVKFYSLQKPGPPPVDLDADDLAPWLTDFAETAAAIELMDLVVSVDTAVAHVAGGLGRPTWVLLSNAADWRWPVGHVGSPWYPSVRQVRQVRSGDWTEVLGRVAAGLRAWADGTSIEAPGP